MNALLTQARDRATVVFGRTSQARHAKPLDIRAIALYILGRIVFGLAIAVALAAALSAMSWVG